MKPSIPPVPYKTKTLIVPLATGGYEVEVELRFKVPSRVAAFLDENACGYHVIPSAGIYDEDDAIRTRVRGWKSSLRKARRPLLDYLREAAEEGCDTWIKVAFDLRQFHWIGLLCGRLQVSPGQWYCACAAYNAEVEEASIAKILAQMEEAQ